jgi:hypothetical protein
MGIVALLVLQGDTAVFAEDDWRLDVLAENGLSAENAVLEEYLNGFKPAGAGLAESVGRMGSEVFAEREEAEKEILRMGRQVLPRLRGLPESEDPEIRLRLGRIIETLEAGGRWAGEDLRRRAAADLLAERENKGAPGVPVELFAEIFRQDAPALADRYRRFRFAADEGMGGEVADGAARFKGNHGGDGDQRLILDSMAITGKPEYPAGFRVETRLGAEAGGAGAYHIGVSIGNVRVLFHPELAAGAFRFETVDENTPLTANADMGFRPPAGKLMLMSVDVARRPNGDVALDVTVTHGKRTFRKDAVMKAADIGKIDRIGLDRSGRSGGDALFDDFVLDLSAP